MKNVAKFEKVSYQEFKKACASVSYTHLVMKANLREWLHIMELRNSPAAYPEMRQMMNLLIQKAQAVYPFIFDQAGETHGKT